MTALDRIYQQKQNRRKLLSTLPINEKVEIIEQLRDLGRTMRRARTQRQMAGPVR